MKLRVRKYSRGAGHVPPKKWFLDRLWRVLGCFLQQFQSIILPKFLRVAWFVQHLTLTSNQWVWLLTFKIKESEWKLRNCSICSYTSYYVVFHESHKFFLVFDCCRFCVVIRFFHPCHFEGLTNPDLIHYIYFTILILEKEPVFPF